MNYKAAYHYLFSEITKIITLLETLQNHQEQVNIPLLLTQLQTNSEALYGTPAPRPAKAPRKGSTL